jgi:tetratricopeptide (TPR) repeat protein
LIGCSTAKESDQPTDQEAAFSGSAGCRDCHERFYELWAPSHHGLAMQPFTAEFAAKELTQRSEKIEVGLQHFRARIEDGQGWIDQLGEEEQKGYKIEYALGGKNVYYFLTPTVRGRLQVLPLAYDVREKEWFDTTASMVRHFTDQTDEALDWSESPLTFNTSCFNCHVSQLSSNYDLETDSYQTVWAEPGINCETCHGPGGEHIRVFREAPEGTIPEDPKIVLISQFTEEQTNDLCAPCHAKMYPITNTFTPGDKYFDHYGLHTLEHIDFYPDGRDLGENYTFTLWRMSPCVQSGQLDCVHCHTSSGRNRHTGEEADNACMPCHSEYVKDPASHSFHAADSTGSRCVACHMPRTVFAKMVRHDHTMLPPTPATTLAFESPNACNLCHTDQDANWANEWVRKWYRPDYQEPFLYRAHLIDAGRKQDWSKLSEMLEYIGSKNRDEVFATSLIRLLENCPDPAKWPALIEAIRDPSPLVRSAAATGLAGNPSAESVATLVEATGDESRLVRIRAAASLTRHPKDELSEQDRRQVRQATHEYESYLKCGPDQWGSHYNLGNYYVDLGKTKEALEAFNIASRLQPKSIPPLVNASMLYARLGNNAAAEQKLRDALAVDPENAVVNFNLGLLLAEKNRPGEAEKLLEIALENNPQMPAAAYNLAIIVAARSPGEAVKWCRRAVELSPGDAKYVYTLAFYLYQSGNIEEASRFLQTLVGDNPEYIDAYALLGRILEEQGRLSEARNVYQKVLEKSLAPSARRQFEVLLARLNR